MHLSNHVVVITGASMGIGEAVARVFLDEGASVVMSSRDLSRVEQARARVGTPERTLAAACDVRDRHQIEALVASIKDLFGKIDVWINNAGYGMMDSVASMSIDECRRLFDTNFFGVIDCMQVVAPVMKTQGSGTIINISSIVGHLPVPFMGAYCASKHALNAISEAARMELEPAGVRVMSVCPGRIKTNFGVNVVRAGEGKKLSESLQQGISAERCARAILRGYLRGKREVFVPWHAWWISHLYELAPQVVEFGMRRMMRG
ncbi:MAG TPA: SDR family NAD(P)-dependent oxidoreductase [Terriglobales bacterium]|nr:SDR family NAD(P)-dependent oxidoreductase [Terriglobales bacterium]